MTVTAGEATGDACETGKFRVLMRSHRHVKRTGDERVQPADFVLVSHAESGLDGTYNDYVEVIHDLFRICPYPSRGGTILRLRELRCCESHAQHPARVFRPMTHW